MHKILLLKRNRHFLSLAAFGAVFFFSFGFSGNLVAQSTTWTGTTSGIWSDPTNWSNGLPGTGSSVILDASVLPNNNITGVPSIDLASLKVINAGTLTLSGSSSPNSITVSGSFAVPNGAILVVGQAGAIINLKLLSTSVGDMSSSGGGIVTMISDGVNTSTFQNDGTLSMGSLGLINQGLNPSNFILSPSGTLQIGSSFGLDVVSGNIQMTGPGTSFSTLASFVYNGSSNQSTGNLLPATVGSLTIANAGNTVTLTNSISIAGGLTISAGAFDIAGKNITSVSSILMTGSTLTATGAGTVTLAGDIATNASASVAVVSAPLNLNGATRTFNVASNALNPDLSITSIISGAAGIIKAGNGTLSLSGSNNFTGTVSLNSGTIQLGNANALGTPAAGTTVSSGAALDLNGNAVAEPITINGTGISSGGALINSSGGAAISGLLALGSNSSIVASVGSIDLTNAGTISGSGYNLILDGAGGGSITSIIGTGSGSVTKLGSGTWTLSGANTLSGGLTLNAGTLNINNASALGNVSGTLTINGGTITSGSALTTLNYPQQWNGDFVFGGANNLNLGTGLVTINSNRNIFISNTLTVGGVVSAGANSLSISGGGVLAFGGGDVTLNNLTVNGGTTLTSSTGNLNISGTFTNSGTFNNHSGNVNYNGASAQTVAAVTYYNLSTSGAGQKNATSNVTVSSNLTNTSVFDMASNTLTVAGVISNAVGTIRFSGNGLSINSGTVEYYGSSQVVASGSYNNLTITQSSLNASLSGATTVNGILTINSGNLVLSGFNLLLGPSSSISIASPSATKMIVATVSGGGEVRKTYSSIGSFTFPIGDNANYTPMTVNVTSGSGFYIGASVANLKHPNNSSSVNYLNRYWNINASASCVATISANYVAGDIIGTETNIKSAQLNGVFNQSTNPWQKFLALSGNTLTVSAANISLGSTSAFTGITGADPTVSISLTPLGSNPICNGGSGVTLNAIPVGDASFLYSWSPGVNTTANYFVNPATTTAYTVSVKDGNGIAASANTTITVNDPPIISVQPTSQTVCLGSGVTFSVVATGTGLTYQWYNGAGAIGGATASTYSILNTTPSDATTYYVVVTGVCGSPSTSSTVSLTLNTPPQIIASPSSSTICENSNTTFTVNAGSTTSPLYQWQVSTDGGSTFSNLSNGAPYSGVTTSTLTITGATFALNGYFYRAILSSGAVPVCTPSVTTASGILTINRLPDVVATPASQSICSGNPSGIALSTSNGVVGVVYNWTVVQSNVSGAAASSGVNIVQTLSATTTSPGTATYTITPTAAGCPGTPVNVVVTVNPIPGVPTITSPAGPYTQCVGTGNVTLTSNTPASTSSYQWYAGGSAIGGATGISYTVLDAVANSGDYTVTAVGIGPTFCASGQSPAESVTINPLPLATPGVSPASVAVCSGGTVTVTVAGSQSGVNYQLFIGAAPVSGVVAGTGGNIALVSGVLAASGTVTVKATGAVTGCTAALSGTTVVTVNPVPAPTLGASSTAVCQGTNVTFTAGAGGGPAISNYDFRLNGTSVQSGPIATYSTAALVNGDVVTVIAGTGTVPVCSATSASITMTIYAVPSVTNSMAPSVCSSVGYSVNPQANITNGVASTFLWSVNYNGLLGGAGGGSGAGPIVETSLLKNLTGGPVPVNVVYTVTPTSITGLCPGLNYTVTVPVSSEPVGSNASPAAICSDATVGYNLQNNVNTTGNNQAATFSWAAGANPNVSGQSLSPQNGAVITDVLVNAFGSNQPITYTVTPTGTNGCVGSNFTVTVTVESKPTFNSGASPAVCSGSAFTIFPQASVNNGMAGNTFTWTGSYPPGLTGGAGSGGGNITETLGNATAGALAATYTITPKSSIGCVGPSFAITQTVAPTPVITNPVLAQSFCGSGLATFTPVINVGASSYSWTGTTMAGTVTGVTGTMTNSPVSDNLTNTGSTIATVRYRVTPTGPPATSCPGNFVDFVVTVYPSPTMSISNPPPTSTICNVTATNIGLTSPTANALITLQNVNYGSVIGGTLTNLQTFSPPYTIAETLTNNTTSPITVTYSFSVSANGCTNVGPFNTSVVVQPSAVFSVTNNTSSVCQGTPTNIVLSSSTSGQQVKVTNVVVTGGATGFTPIGTIFNGFPVNSTIADNLVNPTSSPQTVTYTFEGSIGGACVNPVHQTAVVTIDPLPNVVAAPASQSICSGGGTGISLSTSNGVAGVVYSWTVVQSNVTGAAPGSGTFINQALTATTASAGTATYSITPAANGCPGLPAMVVVTVNPVPAPTLGASSTAVCQGTNVTFTAGAGGGPAISNYDFRLNGTSVQSGPIATYSTAALVNGDVVTVIAGTGTVPVCSATSASITMTIYAVPSVTNSMAPSVCSSVGYSVNPQANITNGVASTFLWSVNYNGLLGGAGGGSGAGPIVETSLLKNLTGGPVPVNVVYTVTPTSITGLCPGLNYTVTVPVSSEPVGSNASPAAICSDATVGYNLQNNVNTTGNNQAATFSWAAGANPNVSGQSLSPQNGAVITDVLVNAFGSNQPITYTVTPTGTNGCVGSNFTVTVTVESKPTFNSGASPAVCSGSAFTIFPQASVNNGMAGNTFTWTGSYPPGLTGGAGSGGGNITETLGNATAGALAATYTITPKSSIGCVGPSFAITQTVAPTPVITNPVLAQSFCGSGLATFTPVINVGASSYSWTGTTMAGTVTGVTGTMTNSPVSDNLTNTGSTIATVRYRVTPTGPPATSCPGNFVDFVVTVYPSPTMSISNPPPTSTICNVTATNIGLTSPTANALITLQNVNYGSVIGGTLTNLQTFSPPYTIAETLTNNTTSPITVTYSFSVSANGCTNVGPFNTSVVVQPSAVFSVTNNTSSVCQGTPTNIVLSSSTSGQQVKVTNVVVTGGATGFTPIGTIFNGFPVNSTIADNLVNPTSSPQTVTYTFEGSIGGACVNPVHQTAVVTVSPTPVMTFNNLSATICSGSATNITLNSATGGAILTLQSVSYGATTGGTLTALQIFSPGYTISETLANNTISPITVTYSFSVSANGCTNSGPFSTNVIVRPNAKFSVSNIPSSICQGTLTNIILNSSTTGEQVRIANVVATGGITGFSPINTIYNSFPSTIGDNLINPTNFPQTVTYTFEGSLGGACINPTQSSTIVTVNPAPPNLSVAPLSSTICSGTPVNIALSSATSNAVITLTNVSYYGAIGSLVNGDTFIPTFNITETLVNTTNAPITVTYTFQSSANGCTNPATTTASVIVNPIPNASANNNLICSGGTAGVVISNPNNVIGTLYQWSFAATNVSGANNQATPSPGPINDILNATTTAQGTVAYTVTPFGPTGCAGAPYVATVTVQPVPSFSFINSSPQICSGSQTNIQLNTPAVGGQVRLKSVNYNGASGTLSVGDLFLNNQFVTEVLTNSTNSPITVTYQFEAIVGVCGPSAPQNILVVVNPNPSLSVNNTTPTICSGTSPSITLTSPTIGASISLQNVVYGAVTGGLYALGGTFVTGAVITEAPGGLVNNTTNPISVTYTFSVSTPSTSPSCPLSITTQSTTLQVLPAPSFTYTNGAGIICSGNQANITLNTSVTGGLIKLQSVIYGSVVGTLSPGLLYSNGQKITEVLVNPTNAPVTVTYQFVGIVGSCAPSALQSTSVTVNPAPVFSINNTTPAVCEGSAVSIMLNSPTSSAIITLSSVNYNGMAGTLSAGATFTNEQSITETITTPFTTTIPATYSFTVAAAGCSNPVAQQTTVAVTKQATVSLPANYTICEPLTIPLTGTIGGSAFTGLWSIVTGAGTLSATNVSGSTVTANYTVAPSDVSSVVTFRLTTNDPDGSGPCVPAFGNISITIYQAAKVSAPANLPICQNIHSVMLGSGVTIGGSTTSTLWTGGAGSFTNANNLNATYNLALGEQTQLVPITIPLTITAYPPLGGPCTLVSTITNLIVNPLPVVAFSGFPLGFPPQVVANSDSLLLTGNATGGLFTIIPTPAAIGNTGHNPVDTAHFYPRLAFIGTNTVTYTYTDINSCTNSTSQNIVVNPVTNSNYAIAGKVTFVTGEIPICSSEGNVQLLGNPAPNGLPKTGFFAVGPKIGFSAGYGGLQSATDSTLIANSFITSGGNIYLNTNGLSSKVYLIYYQYENSFGAVTNKLRSILVYPSPQANFLSSNNCVISPVTFTDQSSLAPTLLPPIYPSSSIDKYIWNFGDGSPQNLFTSPFTSTTHLYGAPNNYNVTLQVITSSPNGGCTNTSAPYHLTVGEPPTSLFSWSAICTNDSTKFANNSKPGAVSVITNLQWDFGDGYTISGSPAAKVSNTATTFTSGTYSNPNHKYATNGTYQVKLVVANNNGCFDTSPAKKVFILPYKTVNLSSTSTYTENFENPLSSGGGWVPEAFNATNSTIADTIASDTSWVWSKPNGLVIQPNAQTGNLSWWTGKNANSYYYYENSVINGPCFNFTKLNRPMVALDYWVNTDANADGSVLQYSVDGGLTWQLVGPFAGVPVSQRNQGINWYPPGAIVTANPGQQPSFGPYGWTGGTQAGWYRGSFNLDMIPQVNPLNNLDTLRKQVRIRIGFASRGIPNGGLKYDGFAFDNVFIGNKTKNVLIEEFTNANLSASTIADAYFNNLYKNQISNAFRKGVSDFHDIQYHVRFPSPDIFNQANSDDPAARALFYGVQQPPYAVLDGLQAEAKITFGNNYQGIDSIEIDRQALRKPQITIYKVDTVATGKNNAINARIHIQADTVITYPLYAQVALVEDSVVVPGFVNPFRNVVRQLLYLGGAGITSTATMQPNDSLIFTAGEVKINTQITNPKKLRLVAFIQNNQASGTHEIIQSMVLPVNNKIGTVITAIESVMAPLENIQLYPNPASDKFNFALPGDYPNGSIFKISDQRGINVMSGDFSDAFKGQKTVDVTSLTNGMYIVAVGAPGQNVVYRKLVVLNSN